MWKRDESICNCGPRYTAEVLGRCLYCSRPKGDAQTMGRRKGSGEKQEKKTPVKIRPIPRKHAGKITEPWAIMERLIEEVDHFAHLKGARIKLWWQKDWKADVDGIATGAQVCKASELDRNIAEEAGAETPDVFIKLPESQWPALDATEKEHRIFHELCHVKPAKNANGNQKRDSKDRPLWRLSRHPITAFHEEIERYGIDRVISHNEEVLKAIRHADRPLEKEFDKAEARASADWERLGIDALQKHDSRITDTAINQLLARFTTCGDVRAAMLAKPEWWAKDAGVNRRYKEPVESAINQMLAQATA